MTLRHVNESVARELATAFERAEGEALERTWREDARFHIAGHNPFSGTYQGRAAVRELAERRRQYLAGRVHHMELVGTSAGECHVALLFRTRATVGDCPLTWRSTTLFFFEHGFLTDCWMLVDDEVAFNTFWGAADRAKPPPAPPPALSAQGSGAAG